MPTTLPSSTYRTSGAAARLERRLLPAYLVSLAAFCGLLVINGPEMRAAAEAQEARVVEEENRAFCNKFGIGPETGRFAECAAALREIRARHLQRNISDFIF